MAATPARYSSDADHRHAVLSLRLIGASLLYSLLIAAVIAGLHIALRYQQSLTDTRQTFIEIRQSHLPALTASLWDVDNARTALLLDGLLLLPHVGHLELVDETGASFKRERPDAGAAIAVQTFLLTHPDLPSSLGRLTVTLTDDALLAQLFQRALEIALVTTLTLILGAAVVLLLFQRRVARHLSTLSAYTAGLDIQQLDSRLELQRPPSQRPDELDQVVGSINRMRERIRDDIRQRQRLERELSLHRDHLEAMVEARTRELSEQALQLENQNQELDAYAHTVAHDLKTPLTTVRGLASLLLHGGALLPPEQQKTSLEKIHDTSIKMSGIIEELLKFSAFRHAEAETGVPIDMAQLIAEAQHRLADLMTQRGARVSSPVDWPTMRGVPAWIEEVWVNYLSNALKYGGEHPILEFGYDDSGAGTIRCWLRDYGPGIAESQRQHLFTAYRRLHQGNEEGHGLGLSIVKRIVERLGGEVGCDAAEGGGSRFWFSLPRA